MNAAPEKQSLFLRLGPTVFAVALVALFVYLGNWQDGKGDRLLAQRQQLQARAQLSHRPVGPEAVDPVQLDGVPVRVTGQYEPAGQFFIDNRQEGGRPGVHVITPLRIDGGERRILVNRGWVGWGNGRGSLPRVSTPEGPVEVRGVAMTPVVKKFLLMPEHAETPSRLWSQLDLARFEQSVRYPVQPVVLLQDRADARDGLIRNWQPPEDKVAMHKSYAMQWYGLTILTAGLWIWYVLIRPRRQARPQA